MSPLQKVIDDLRDYGMKSKKNVSHGVSIEWDVFAAEPHGYTATFIIESAHISGRGPTPEDAIAKLADKLETRLKTTVV